MTGKLIAGWAFDQDAPNMALPVDMYVDGVFSTTLTAGQSRPDVNAFLGFPNHAFSGALPTLSFGTHKDRYLCFGIAGKCLRADRF